MHKKLYRSREHRLLSGVMGGLGEYFAIDPIILRLILIVVVLASGIFPGIIAYIIAAFYIPEAPAVIHEQVIDADSAV